ncbi:hypothetical protein [Oceanobacter kriegii]|uniref:hypothetical protein n=1 Tax=Oceanobacter kriegii TaxID=64972 RepID=UPI0003FD7CAB|nr:hypothetical protein [Oceanobacter kriegii]
MDRMKKIAAMVAMVIFGTFSVIWVATSFQDPTYQEKPDWDGKTAIVAELKKRNHSKISINAVSKALDGFVRQCSPFVAYWGDVESTKITVGDTVQSMLKDKGWKRQLQLELHLKESPALIPNSYRANGHTCYVDLSLNGNQGMTVSKTPCQKLCALSEKEISSGGYVVLNKTVAFSEAPEEQHIQRVKSQFSSWDGSHKNLVTMLKAALNNPDGFEHVKTTYSDQGSNLIIIMDYRATNGFGAPTLHKLAASVDMDGNVLQILSSN